MDYQIVLSTWARADLRDTVRYISIDSPDRALAFGKFLIQKTKLLAQFPELGRIVPEFRDPAIREIIVRSYRVGEALRAACGDHSLLARRTRLS